MPKYPKSLRMGDSSSVFEREPELYTLHSTQAVDPTRAGTGAGTGSSRSGRGAGHDTPVAVVHDGAVDVFAVYRGQPSRDVSGADVGPVYSAGPGGPLAVPTGRVLVHLAKGMKPEERRQEFASAGFEIEKTLSYAPSAAWLKPRKGGIAQALSNLDALKKTPGVEHMEPQLLMARAFKHT